MKWSLSQFFERIFGTNHLPYYRYIPYKLESRHAIHLHDQDSGHKPHRETDFLSVGFRHHIHHNSAMCSWLLLTLPPVPLLAAILIPTLLAREHLEPSQVARVARAHTGLRLTRYVALLVDAFQHGRAAPRAFGWIVGSKSKFAHVHYYPAFVFLISLLALFSDSAMHLHKVLIKSSVKSSILHCFTFIATSVKPVTESNSTFNISCVMRHPEFSP